MLKQTGTNNNFRIIATHNKRKGSMRKRSATLNNDTNIHKVMLYIQTVYIDYLTYILYSIL